MNKINLITPEELATFDRIDRDCLKMHVMPPPKTFINMKVHMPNGELVSELDMVSRSWVRNAYNMALVRMLPSDVGAGHTTFGAGVLGIKKTDNSVETPASSASNIWNYVGRWTGAANAVNQGIVVGTGVGAESFESNTLGTLIAAGNSATQLAYQADDVGTFSYAAGTKKWTLTKYRIMNNNSGGSISVSEVGIICNLYGNTVIFLMCRDLLGAAVVVANTAQLTVTYTMEMTFPA